MAKGVGKKWLEFATRPGASAGDAARRVARVRMKELARAIGTCGGDASVARVHELRVAARRAGATLRALGPCLESRGVQRARRVVRDIRRAAGLLRDTDVHAELFNALHELGGARSVNGVAGVAGIEEILRWLDRDRSLAQRRLEEALLIATPALVRRLANELRESDVAGPTEALIAEVARSRVAEMVKRARAAAAKDLRELEALHELRLSIKDLRYGVEVLGPALDEAARSEAYPRLVEAQQRLGEVNDLATLVERMERYARELATTHASEQPEGHEDLSRVVHQLRTRFARVRDLRALRAAAWWSEVDAERIWSVLGGTDAADAMGSGAAENSVGKASVDSAVDSAVDSVVTPIVSRPEAVRSESMSGISDMSETSGGPAQQANLWIGGTRLAVIDIGSNSIRLLAVELVDEKSWRTLAEERAMTRLAQGLSATGEINAEAMARSLEAIVRFKAVAEKQGCALVRAFATAAVREATNRDDFISLVKDRTGITLELVSALDEGKLTHRSVARVLDLHEGTAAVVDLGGGSLEVVFSHGGVITGNTSMPLGSVRLTEAFGGAEACAGRRYSEMRKHAAGLIRKRVRKPDSPPTIMVGCGGNFTSLLTLAAASRGVLLDRNSPALTSLGPVSRAQVRTMLDELRAMSLEQRLRVPGLPSDRADIVVAGLATIEQLMKHLGATQLHVHPGGFREGLLMRVVEEMLRERTRDAAVPGDEEELGVVREFARACSYPRAHCEHVATLALSLYDQLVRGSDLIKGLGSDRSERMMLEASCVLHDIGVLVEYDRHHKHGALMVRHAELRGLTARQIEVLACLVRYHRKREPTVRHAEFEALSETDRALVRRLSGLMRVADGLDRSHAQNVRSVHVRFGADGATIEVDSRSDASADIEAALDKAGLLESVMGTRLRIQPTAHEPSSANTGRTEGAAGTNRSAARGAAATVGEDERGGEAPGRTPRVGAGLAGPSMPVTPVTPVTPIAPGMANGQHTEPHG